MILVQKNQKSFGRKPLLPYFCDPIDQMSLSRWPVRLSVRSPGFHPGKTGSTPVPATKPSRAIGKAFLVLVNDGSLIDRMGIKKAIIADGLTKI